MKLLVKNAGCLSLLFSFVHFSCEAMGNEPIYQNVDQVHIRPEHHAVDVRSEDSDCEFDDDDRYAAAHISALAPEVNQGEEEGWPSWSPGKKVLFVGGLLAGAGVLGGVGTAAAYAAGGFGSPVPSPMATPKEPLCTPGYIFVNRENVSLDCVDGHFQPAAPLAQGKDCQPGKHYFYENYAPGLAMECTSQGDWGKWGPFDRTSAASPRPLNPPGDMCDSAARVLYIDEESGLHLRCIGGKLNPQRLLRGQDCVPDRVYVNLEDNSRKAYCTSNGKWDDLACEEGRFNAQSGPSGQYKCIDGKQIWVPQAPTTTSTMPPLDPRGDMCNPAAEIVYIDESGSYLDCIGGQLQPQRLSGGQDCVPGRVYVNLENNTKKADCTSEGKWRDLACVEGRFDPQAGPSGQYACVDGKQNWLPKTTTTTSTMAPPPSTTTPGPLEHCYVDITEVVDCTRWDHQDDECWPVRGRDCPPQTLVKGAPSDCEYDPQPQKCPNWVAHPDAGKECWQLRCPHGEGQIEVWRAGDRFEVFLLNQELGAHHALKDENGRFIKLPQDIGRVVKQGSHLICDQIEGVKGDTRPHKTVIYLGSWNEDSAVLAHAQARTSHHRTNVATEAYIDINERQYRTFRAENGIQIGLHEVLHPLMGRGRAQCDRHMTEISIPNKWRNGTTPQWTFHGPNTMQRTGGVPLYFDDHIDRVPQDQFGRELPEEGVPFYPLFGTGMSKGTWTSSPLIPCMLNDCGYDIPCNTQRMPPPENVLAREGPPPQRFD